MGIREWGKMGVKNVNSETCTVLKFKALFGVVTGGRKREVVSVDEGKVTD